MANQDASNPSHVVFDLFAHAQSCKDVQRHFAELCQHLELDPRDYSSFYTKIKERLNYWKAKALWVKLDKRASHPDYQQRKACAKNTCLVLGAGPCGLRTAIELALLGAHVVVLEKRETFARNNVLHLWPYTIYDLRSLSAKKFYGKFCTGALDHISIRQLQLILLKVALLLGVEVNTGVEYRGLLDPSDDTGWRAKLHPESHPAGKLQFDVFISAGGGRFVPDGFRRKELRGKLAIGITANFINRRTAAETQVAEISGVARIYNQKFFHDLLTETGIDLENIVYYKDDTHYFVMTAKKKSLLQKGVIKQDFSDAEQLLAPENVDQEALLDYAQDAAHFSTGYRLPDLEFATHGGRPDVAMFDFTCMHRAENASLVRERRGKKLLMGLVGDCLVEPFWPLGTGVARGFLASFDAAWMVRSWGLGVPVLKVLAQRESVYQLLSQTTPENTIKNYSGYSINPTTRYRHVNLSSIQPNQVQHLYYVEDDVDFNRPSKKLKSRWSYMPQDSTGGFDELLSWCQQNTVGYEKAKVTDLTQSWRSGLALCALIHHFKPHLIDISSLTESNAIHNNQLAFSILEMELGIPPVMSASDMATRGQIDKLSMVLYLTQVHDAFTQRTPTTEPAGLLTPAKTVSFARTQAAVIFLNTLKRNSLQRLKKKLAAEQEAKEIKMSLGEEEHPVAPELRPADPEPDPGPDATSSPVQASSEECYFCCQRVYVLERISTEGKFFHRSCFTCHQCGATLRLGDYTFRQDNGHFYCELHSRDPELENGRRMSSSLDTRGEFQEEDDDEEEENDHTLCPSDDDYYEHTLDSGPSVPFGEPKELDDILPEPTDKPSQPPPGPALERGLEPAEEQGVPSQPTPVPAPRLSWQGTPTQTPPHSPPVPKPRSVLPANPNTPDAPPSDTGSSTATPDSRPKQSLRKLKLSDEEKTQLVNLSFSQDSDSETQGGSSSCSSSSATTSGPSPPKPAALGPDGQEEEGYWSGGAGMPRRDRRNRHCFRRKEGPGRQNQPTKVRSKFSPWNLSSPRLGREHRLSVHNSHPGRVETTFRHTSLISEDGADGDDDDDGDDDNDDAYEDEEDMFEKNDQFEAITPAEVEKLELMKMKTLERRAKMSELQRFRKAQSIQRRLEEIEVTFKDLEEKGVELERALRGEAGNGGSPDMIGHWIQLVHQKNALVSEESDLMVASKQLELEDRQSMLEMEVRKHMNLSDSEKTEEQRVDEARAMQQMIETVDMRNSLVAFLEEKRLKELSDEEHVVTLMEAKRHSTAGAQVHWA